MWLPARGRHHFQPSQPLSHRPEAGLRRPAAGGFPRCTQYRKFSKNSGPRQVKDTSEIGAAREHPEAPGARGPGIRARFRAVAPLPVAGRLLSVDSRFAGARMLGGLSVTFLPLFLFLRAALSHSLSAVLIYLRGSPGWALDVSELPGSGSVTGNSPVHRKGGRGAQEGVSR